MTKRIIKKSNFIGGELSPDLDARTDISVYDSGCKELSNAIVWQQGGITKRPGTTHIYSAGRTPLETVFSGTGTVTSGDGNWTGLYTECEGECGYNLSEVGYPPYSLQTSIDNGSTWQTVKTVLSGSFTWKCKPFACNTSKIRVVDVDGNTSETTDAEKYCPTCVDVEMDIYYPADPIYDNWMNCADEAYITLTDSDVCCPYEITAFSDGGTIEEGIVKTGQQTWTYTVPGDYDSCCLGDYVDLTLLCCDVEKDEQHIDIGAPVPLLWSYDNSETIDPESEEEIEVIFGRGNAFSWLSEDEPEFSWKYEFTTTPFNTIITTEDVEPGQVGHFNVFDECGDNVLGEIEATGPLTWDEENSTKDIVPEWQRGTIYWLAGEAPFFVIVTPIDDASGNVGFSQGTGLPTNKVTSSHASYIYASNNACGSFLISVQDSLGAPPNWHGDIVYGVITCVAGEIALGDWYRDETKQNACTMPDPADRGAFHPDDNDGPALNECHSSACSVSYFNCNETTFVTQSIYASKYRNTEAECIAIMTIVDCGTTISGGVNCLSNNWQWCQCWNFNMITDCHPYWGCDTQYDINSGDFWQFLDENTGNAHYGYTCEPMYEGAPGPYYCDPPWTKPEPGCSGIPY